MSRSLAVFRHNVRLLLGDPGPIVLFFITPLLSIAIMQPALETVLVEQGFTNANGSEQVVPGFVAMFAFFWVSWVGRNFIAEHGWNTWQRLRATQTSSLELLFGKLLPPIIIISTQVTLLFAIGALLFDLKSEGPILSLLVIVPPFVAVIVSLTLALVGLCRTLSQIDAAGNLLTMVFAALGGSLAPVSALPGWAQDIAPGVPHYWALEAARDVILEGKGLDAVLPRAGALCGFAILFTVVAAKTFRIADTKVAT
jgi:ABC-2 type transport system permease protein